jgi:cytochrome oxidase Cu insertion factor (SCO1/SenC/PrrC family)
MKIPLLPVFMVLFGLMTGVAAVSADAGEAQTSKKKKRSQFGRSPSVGKAIPKITVKTHDGKKTVALHKPKRLTVLVFGSHT